MTVSIARSTMTSATPLTGEVNTGAQVLDAALASGFGSYTPGSPWAIAYSDNYDTIVLRPPAGNRFYYQISDNNVGEPRLMQIRGYESMTAYDTGTNPFPTVVQESTVDIAKSDTADDSGRYWLCASNGEICYFVTSQAASGVLTIGIHVFGTFTSQASSGDGYCDILMARTYTETSGNASTSYANFINSECAITSVIQSAYLARNYTLIGGPTFCGYHGDTHKTDVMLLNQIDNGFYVSPIWITEKVTDRGVIRGRLPGLWRVLHNWEDVTYGDTFAGTGDLAGKSFEVITVNGGAFALETSDTW